MLYIITLTKYKLSVALQPLDRNPNKITVQHIVDSAVGSSDNTFHVPEFVHGSTTSADITSHVCCCERLLDVELRESTDTHLITGLQEPDLLVFILFNRMRGNQLGCLHGLYFRCHFVLQDLDKDVIGRRRRDVGRSIRG